MIHISLGINLQSGPWGGGNQFGHSLYAYLQKKNIDITFNLKRNDLDLILLVEPRSSSKTSTFTHKDIYRYLLLKNKNAIIAHRVNECDERKGTNYVNKTILEAKQITDFTIFISDWLHNLFFSLGYIQKNSSVIRNGANKEIFNRENYQAWNGKDKLRIVTHHWGANILKGFDIYQRLDKLLASNDYNKRCEFTYIGNVPDGINLSNTSVINPLSGYALAKSIKSNHVYLTASQNEPAGMHHIEGALCGLPVLYRLSGALPEYCDGFGVGFTYDDFETKLNQMYDTYQSWVNIMPKYPYDSDRMCQQYYELFIELLDNREKIITQRKQINNLRFFLSSFLPYKLYYRLRGILIHGLKYISRA